MALAGSKQHEVLLDRLHASHATPGDVEAAPRTASEDLDFESLTFEEAGSVMIQNDETAAGLTATNDESGQSSTAQEAMLRSEEAQIQQERVISSLSAGPSSQSGDWPAILSGLPITGALAASGDPQPSVPPRLGPADFELLKVVGRGSFGKVFQVRKKDTGEIYAMKVMLKSKILEKDHSDYIRAESNILRNVTHPFVVTLRFSFQTSHKLYLVMDFINGGHLFYNLYREACFKTAEARFFTAEIVSAISHLHSMGYVHRDLKPENVLLDRDGHLRITDFGLAKDDMTDDMRANSFIGTLEYIAPEIIEGSGHGKAVDWWSVGILLFEMIEGRTPFRLRGNNIQSLQKQIRGGKLKLQREPLFRPPWVDSDARDLIKSLLQRDPTKRLGYGPQGSENVKKHKFFKTINWKLLDAKQLSSPFKPKMEGDCTSVEMFDKLWTDEKAIDSPPPSPAQGLNGHTAFQNFTYTEPALLSFYQQKLQGSS